MAVVALVLLGMANRATVGDLPLRHTGVDFHFHVGPVVQRMRWTSLWPLVLWPCNRVTLGLTFCEFLQVAVAAHVGGGHPQVGSVICLLLRIDVDVAIDTTDFLQLLLRTEFTQRTQVRLDLLQFRLLVEGVVFGGELANLVKIGVSTLFPEYHPARRLVGMALDALFTRGDILDRRGWLVERKRVQVFAEWKRLPIFGVLPFPCAFGGVQVAFHQGLM